MPRRAFLRSTSVGLGMAVVPRIAWALDDGPESGHEALARVRAEALEQGLALLVVVPREGRDELAERFSTFFQTAVPHQLVDLALVRRVAARRGELEELLGARRAAGLGADSALVLLDPDGSVRGLPRRELLGRAPGATALCRRFAETLEELIHPHPGAIERRIRSFERAQAAHVLSHGSGDSELLARGFALRLAAAKARASRRRRLLGQLAELFEDALRNEPLQRAHWVARRNVETPEPGCRGLPCGTGYIPPASRRFLAFFTRED